MSFHDQAVLVTGASRGIGRAVALALGERGATVAVHHREQAGAARTVADEIARRGGRAFTVQADLADADAPRALVAAVRGGLGEPAALHGIVAAAGVLVTGSVEAVTADDLRRAFAVNVQAPLLLVREALPLLGPGSRIVTVSAAITRWANPDLLVQSSSKAALQDLSRNLAAALGPRGIGVVDVAPGVTRTDLAAGALTADGEAAVAAGTALARVGEPDDVADAVVALLSPAARWITGQVVEVSGGLRL